MKNKSQLTIEFLIIIGVSFFVILILLGVTLVLYRQNTYNQQYAAVNDLGRYLQEEFLLASQLEDGYTHTIQVPYTINEVTYTLQIGQTNPSHSYLVLAYDAIEIFYLIPPVTGEIKKGNNYINKINDTLIISQ